MKKRTFRRSAVLHQVVYVFFLLLGTSALLTILLFLLQAFGLTISDNMYMLLFFLGLSVIIGTILASFFSRFIVRPYKRLNEATREIAAGNFDVRIEPKGPNEVVELAENFNTMAKELSSIQTMRSDFVNDVSHEFKTPVASIKGFAKLLKKDTLSVESRHEYLDIIIKEADRLSLLAENTLLLSRLEKQEIITGQTTFSLDEQLRRAILMLEGSFHQKELILHTNLCNAMYTGNEEMLIQVWINLIGNAVKFTEPNGTISISLYPEDNRYVVEIADTGIGMSEEIIKHSFEKFYQGDASHSISGNGLGLSLVKKIVEISDGQIRIASTEQKGTTVFVRLPRQHKS